MKKSLLVIPVLLILGACSKSATTAKAEETTVNSVPRTQAQVNNNIPAEYKQVTTNEYGIKIYGKIVGNTDGAIDGASNIAKSVIKNNALNDKDSKSNGWTFTYSEYYSEAYGGTVILRTNDKNGGQSIYNENGDCFASGKAVTDMEKWLGNYRLGNAIADAMDKKYK